MPTPALATGPRQATIRPPYMVDISGSIPPPNARLHAPITATESKSQGRDPPKHALYLHLHETHSTSTDPRSDHRYHRDGTTRPPPRKLKRGHELSQFYPRTTIQWQTCQAIRTRPYGRMSLLPSPRLVHSHRREVQSTQKPLDKPSQRGMLAHTRGNTQLRKGGRLTIKRT
jgi:hypothetical protein